MNHWSIKVKVTTEDMDTGKLRAKTDTYLVQAETIEAAQTLIRQYFHGTTMEHEVRSISKSGILEYVTAETLQK